MGSEKALPKLGTLWIGGKWTFVEYVCMRSFVDAGHELTVYCDLENPPLAYTDGVKIVDYREICESPYPLDVAHRTGLATFSDIFRYHMIAQTGKVWVDLDAYCVRPFDFKTPYLFAIDKDEWGERVASGVLGLPQDSQTLQLCLDFVSQKNPIPPFYNYKRRKAMQERIDKGETWTLSEMGFAIVGPKLLSHYLYQTGESIYTFPQDVFYPGPRPSRHPLLRKEFPIEKLETKITYSVHIFGKTKHMLREDFGGKLPEGCYLDVICKRHGVDFEKYPV